MKKLMAGALTLTVLMSGVQSVVQDNSVYAAKSKVTYKIVNKKTNLNYKTIEEQSDALNAGEKQVKVEGKKGYKIVVYKQTLSKGKVIKSTFVKIKKKVNPVNKVVLVGTKKASDNVATTPPTSTTPVEKTELLKVTEPLAFDTKSEQDPTLEKGKQVVVREGKEGVREKAYNQRIVDGKVISTTPAYVRVITEPISKIIKVGTKPVEKTELLKVTEPLAFDTKTENDPTLEKGKQVVVREGKNGVREKAYNQRIVDGKVVSTTPAYVRVITEPISKIIKVGTKPVEKTELLKVNEPLAFDIKTENDPTLEKGKQVVVREGKNGVREKAYNQRIVDGKVVSTTPAYVRVITEPIHKIIKVGTKPVEKTELLKVRETLAYQTIYQNDPTLERDKQVVVREGKNGIREKAYNQRFVDGVLLSTTPAYVTVVEEPVHKILKIGTKDISK